MISNFIKKIKKNQKILVAYSGGLDSTVLLYQLIPFIIKKPFLQIRAIHINHQINPESEKWMKHCKKICKKFLITLIIKKINIKKKNNFQENARKLRYQIIKKNMIKNEILVTGHHLNDQCETLFLSLKRSKGVYGLSGIPYINSVNKNKIIIRPLLKIYKTKIKNWAIKNNIHWINDNSNLNNKYDRNFIRNKIINKIQKKWPYFIQNCTRSMKFCYQQEISINYFLEKIIFKNTLFNDSIKIKIFYKYPQEIQKLLIRKWLFINTNQKISYKENKNIYNKMIVLKNNINQKINIKNITIQKYKKKIFYIPKYKNIKNKIIFWYNYQKPLKLPEKMGFLIQDQYGTLLPKPKKLDLINIRFQLDKKVYLNNKNIKKKNIFQENKILPWNRNRIPFLFYNNKLISILGMQNIDNIKSHTIKTWRISWINLIS
ncbi:tRNA lysidine(34) synthetase TilS [Buchnera aphidicola]|uniref:tRNA(Ile)-lysidine synthase n=1 Tax=Buchnera aphidicola (Therioaphis trifolii) TaxID=1241884 RepID=A0A4D6YK76_9GAMM|nr:tRNA lysidine(34) synthetase TilS [Buchnera aphidicola]QCI27091.1 tRNA lysidine(34) synthetase TilS [Buchnera aphidicola (Therioaphis trifolii)]